MARRAFGASFEGSWAGLSTHAWQPFWASANVSECVLVCLCVLARFTVYIHKLINVKVSFLHEEFSMLIPNAIFDSHSAGWQKTDREVVFCRVRGVDGSCAKHLTVESYMDIYASNSYTYYY